MLTDLNGLYGFLPFAGEARRVGLKAIFGVELTGSKQGGGRLIAIAEDQTGYRALCRLVRSKATSSVSTRSSTTSTPGS